MGVWGVLRSAQQALRTGDGNRASEQSREQRRPIAATIRPSDRGAKIGDVERVSLEDRRIVTPMMTGSAHACSVSGPGSSFVRM
jgi:hypothetical protein